MGLRLIVNLHILLHLRDELIYNEVSFLLKLKFECAKVDPASLLLGFRCTRGGGGLVLLMFLSNDYYIAIQIETYLDFFHTWISSNFPPFPVLYQAFHYLFMILELYQNYAFIRKKLEMLLLF